MVEFVSLAEGARHRRIAKYAAIAVLGGAISGYAIHEHNTAQNLAAQNIVAASALSSTRQEVKDLAAKVNMMASRSEAQAVFSSPSTSAPSTQQSAQNASAHRRPSPAHRQSEDPRYKKLQSQIDAQGKTLEQTRTELTGDLANTRTELSGSIAHTHDELVLLEKKGERSYAEFDLSKSKQFHREGPLELRLKKANIKHHYADLDLMVDDRDMSQKHVNLYQPVMFSTPDSPQPVQVIINDIDKDHIHGYVSAPKYGQSELAAMSAGNAAQGSTQTTSNDQPAPRQKLPLPQE